MGKNKSHRSSLKIASVIRKKAKAKHARMKKEAKTKKYPKRTRKMLKAPQTMPFREMIEAQVHESSAFLNDVIRPIQSTRNEDKTNPYDKHLEEVKKQIAAQHNERIREANESFQALTECIENADAIVQVLDARDPTACRLCEAENETIRGKNKPMIIFLNKIDLVPREVVIGWIHELGNIAPTIAISALNQGESLPIVQQVIESVAPNAQKIGVIGIPGVGKSTICSFNEELFVEVQSYKFIDISPEVALLKAGDYLNSRFDLAVRTMSRKVDDNLFLAYQIPEQETPEDVISALCKKWQMKQHLASAKFVDLLLDGTIPFCTMPENSENSYENLQQQQVAALSTCSETEEMSGKLFIHLQRGDTLIIDNKLLGIEGNEDDEEGDDNEEDDEDGEENNDNDNDN